MTPPSLRGQRQEAPGPDVTRVIVADDHAPLRTALRSVLAALDGITVVGEATTGHAALELISSERPEIALVDIRIPGLAPDALSTQAWAASPETALILLSMHAEAPEGGTLPPGVSALVAKECAAADLPLALLAVLRGYTFVSPSLECKATVAPVRADRAQQPGAAFS